MCVKRERERGEWIADSGIVFFRIIRVFVSPHLHLWLDRRDDLFRRDSPKITRALHRRRRKSPADRYYIRYAATASSSMTALSRRRVFQRCSRVPNRYIAAGDRAINCNANTITRRAAATVARNLLFVKAGPTDRRKFIYATRVWPVAATTIT